jgi:alpha-1,3/alpha-1,6-mannosyltransferase
MPPSSNQKRSNSSRKQSNKPLKIVFIHLDLGIGGAEQLVLNLAGASLTAGHHVTILTTKCDQHHCFSTVKHPDGPLANAVQIWGRWLPAHVLGMATSLCSSIRMLFLSFWAVRCHDDADVFVMDVLPTSLPLLTLCSTRAGVLFYCHFPDKLLTRDTVNGQPTDATSKRSMLRNVYRACLDTLEENTMSYADVIAANSKFTKTTIQTVFPSLQQIPMKVLYPALEMTKFAKPTLDDVKTDAPIVSLNRFERKKNIALLLHAYAYMKERVAKAPPLVIAGGYDTSNVENVEYLQELRALANDLDVQVTFLTSVSDDVRAELLSTCLCLVYTPHLEHFGIVPLEAMYAGRPVVAVHSGGPMETIVDGITGWLCEGTPQGFGTALVTLVQHPSQARTMGQAGHAHVSTTFGVKRLEAEWISLVEETVQQGEMRRRAHQGQYGMLHCLLYLIEAGGMLLVLLIMTAILQQLGVLAPDAQILGTLRRAMMGNKED